MEFLYQVTEIFTYIVVVVEGSPHKNTQTMQRIVLYIRESNQRKK